MIAFIFLFLVIFSNNCLLAGKQVKIVTGDAESLANLTFSNKIDFISKDMENEFAIIPLTKDTTVSKVDIEDFEKAIIEKHMKNRSFLEKHSNKIIFGAGTLIGAGLVLYLQNASQSSIGNEERVR